MLREAYDDFHRHLQDNFENYSIVHVLQPTTHTPINWVKKPWSQLKVGDIVKLADGEPIPADLILLSVLNNEDGICFVETSNLDGESNLKQRHAVSAINGLIRREEDLSSFDGKLFIF